MDKSDMTDTGSEQRYSANLRGEVDSAALYRTLSAVEKHPQLAEVYRRLAAVEETHAAFWRQHITATGQPGVAITG